MAVIRTEGRRTRSQGVNLEEQGKHAAEEYVDISEESDEQARDIGKNYGEELRRPTSGGKVGKWMRHSSSVGARDDDVVEDDGSSEEDDDEAVQGSRGRGRGRRGRGGARGRGQNRAREEGCSTGVPGRGRGKKDMRRKLQEAEKAYMQETHPNVRRIVDHLEEEVLQGQSDPEMADWEHYLPDPGHTRGRMSLYKQSLHVYLGLKRFLAKSMEQVAAEMVEIAQENLKKELKNLQITLMMQDRKIDKLVQLIKDGGIVKVEPDIQPEAMKQ